jgi:pimeloyl-ACP methyl ester carboxylesterase
MSFGADVLWIGVSPALQRFHRPLMNNLSQSHSVRAWEYSQTADEPLCLETAVDLLHRYLARFAQPVHLVGHSISGLVGLLYARQYPQWVRSLTLLSVGANPAWDWQAHYYLQAQLLRCSRYVRLAQMVHNLFGHQPRSKMLALVRLLEQDLFTALSPHTLAHQLYLPPEEVPVPVCICGGEADIVIDPNLLQGWQPYLQTEDGQDRIWQCSNGGHFFHFEHPQATGEQIRDFWQTVEKPLSTLQPSLAPTLGEASGILGQY